MRTYFLLKSKSKSELQNLARLLHQFYPQEIIGFIEFAKTLAHEFLDDREELKRVWENNDISLKSLLNFEGLVFKVLNKYGDSLYYSTMLFSEQLFNLELLPFMIYTLSMYQKSQHCTSSFSQSLDLFDF